ncbi:MAG: hypothetical protein FWF08_04800 [Oscillospiraceae bacterium]|nr:hypothetical protein [Oscillospiraceae bacterium]
MINVYSVLEKIRQMFSFDNGQSANIMPLCQSAAAEVGNAMKTGADPSDIRLIMLAAAIAYCRYLVFASVGEGSTTNYRAGDVTVTKQYSEKLKASEKIRQDAYLAARPLLNDENFVFSSV